MPFKSVGSILGRRLQQLARQRTDADAIRAVISRFPGGEAVAVEYRADESAVVLTAATKAAASELTIRVPQLQSELARAGIRVVRLIVR